MSTESNVKMNKKYDSISKDIEIIKLFCIRVSYLDLDE